MRMRHRLLNALRLVRMMGLTRFVKAAIYHAGTSPRFWERFVVTSLSSRRLSKLLQALPTFSSDALVSVVLPVNNGRSKGVERLVASLKAQSHKNIELIATDSGSTDDTVEWLRREGFTVQEIKPRQFTHSYSRNKGAAVAQGEFLLFVVDDVVFTDRDWLRCAIFLLDKLGADALSSRQTIDENADVYATLLDYYLSSAQSKRPSVNVSRGGCIAGILRSLLPLRATLRSVSIDDTNHLVRRASFERLRFQTPTVEDIDFALRLTKDGGTVVYTNLLSVRHYHSYPLSKIRSYSKRVFLDTKVISRWQPLPIRFRSREALLLAAFHSLSILLLAIDDFGKHARRLSEAASYYSLVDGKIRRRNHVADLLELATRYESSPLSTLSGAQTSSGDKALAIFRDVMGADPPSSLYFDGATFEYYMRRMRDDLSAASFVLSESMNSIDSAEVIVNVCVFQWSNRLMNYLARTELFESALVQYDFDQWGIEDWA